MSTPLLFSGCGQEPVYIFSKQPVLQTYKVKTEKRKLNIRYTVKEVNATKDTK